MCNPAAVVALVALGLTSLLWCAPLLQESRAVKARWRATNADNRSGIATPILPSQPTG